MAANDSNSVKEAKSGSNAASAWRRMASIKLAKISSVTWHQRKASKRKYNGLNKA